MAATDTKKAQADKDAAANKQWLRKRWGEVLIDAGWIGFPSVLIMKWHALGLLATDLCVLIVLLKYWWRPGEAPYPSKATIAKMIGTSEKTVQRSIARMKTMGLIETRRRPGPFGTNEFTFEGLIEKLQPFALEELRARDERRKERDERISRKRARGVVLPFKGSAK